MELKCKVNVLKEPKEVVVIGLLFSGFISPQAAFENRFPEYSFTPTCPVGSPLLVC